MSFAVVKEVSDLANTIQSQTEEFDKLCKLNSIDN